MPSTTSRVAAIAAVFGLQAVSILAQTPLIQQKYSWPYSGPYKVDTTNGPRGIMTGINRCNSTTATQDSLCVNAVVNSIQDFCIYAPPEPNSVIANVEGECVAWCVNGAKYGTRTIPSGAITGMQVVKTPGYLALGMNVNGPLLNTQAGDSGGELDPHGADARGNPIGSLMYSNAFSGTTTGESQVTEWHEFISGSIICLKVCSASVDSRSNLCDNIFDTVGCNVNVPLNYNAIGTTFQSCLGDNQLPPAQNNAAASSGGSIFTPATSQCSTFQSSAIFTVSVAGASSSAASSSASSSASSGSQTTSAPSSVATSAATMSTSSASIATSSRAGAAAGSFPTAAPIAMAAAAAFAYIAAA